LKTFFVRFTIIIFVDVYACQVETAVEVTRDRVEGLCVNGENPAGFVVDVNVSIYSPIEKMPCGKSLVKTEKDVKAKVSKWVQS